MPLHHTLDEFDTFFGRYKSNTHSWHTFNFESAKKKAIFNQDSCVFPEVILVSNCYTYKEKAIKLLPYHSFYGGHIPIVIDAHVQLPLMAVRLKKIHSHQGPH